jgi:hypothetical protein
MAKRAAQRQTAKGVAKSGNRKAAVSPAADEGTPVIIIGDVFLAWLAANYQPLSDSSKKREHEHWRGEPQVQMLAMASGAWLLENLLLAIGSNKRDHNPHKYFCYRRPQAGRPKGVRDLDAVRRTANPDQYLHTFTPLALFDRGWDEEACKHCPLKSAENKGKLYRIAAPARYWGPREEIKSKNHTKGDLRLRHADEPAPEYGAKAAPHQAALAACLQKPRVLVIFDGGYGFREAGSGWEPFLPRNTDNSLQIVLFLRPPFPGVSKDGAASSGGRSGLWNRIVESYADQTTVVVASEKLRREGINISKSLSWERTAQDFAAELFGAPILKELSKLRHMVVRFGLTGAIHYHRTGAQPEESESTLYYDSMYVEGEYRDQDETNYGTMFGLTAVLTATVARSIADGLSNPADAGNARDGDEFNTWVKRGIETGLLNSRMLYCHGFGDSHEHVLRLENEDRWNYQFIAPKADSRDGCPFVTATIPYGSSSWSLLRLNSQTEIEKVARAIVLYGIEKVLGKGEAQRFPTAKFGNYWMVDREEIESFRGIRNLLQDHRDKRPTKPLSIAVFGPPGSGKSSSVKQIVKSISPDADKSFDFRTYNLAQFVEPGELAPALLPIRDVALDGKTAVVFFDEFDSQLGGEKLGWLKYFLPIMQDGEFKHGGEIINTGGAVFVFAGGTSYTYRDFCRLDKGEKELIDFKERKGPDFVSRLRGFVNIRGSDRQDDGQNGKDEYFMIRRALSIRFNLIDAYPSLLNSSNIDIDLNVLNALLKIEVYKHGSRSLRAILDMSRLARQARKFEAAMLPSIDQLDMHVNGKRFMDLLKGGS